jgi:hypothetical protein
MKTAPASSPQSVEKQEGNKRIKQEEERGGEKGGEGERVNAWIERKATDPGRDQEKRDGTLRKRSGVRHPTQMGKFVV